MDQQDRGEQLELVGKVGAHRRQQRQRHHDLAADDPRAAPAKAVGVEQVDHRPRGPLPRPGEIERRHEGPDLVGAQAVAPHLRRDRRRGETQWDAFGDVEQEEGRQPAASGGEEVSRRRGV